jgi:hypothetical protein
VSQSKQQITAAAAAAADDAEIMHMGMSSQELDLTGSREFLDTDTTAQVLAPLLAAGAAITKVSPGQVGSPSPWQS